MRKILPAIILSLFFTTNSFAQFSELKCHNKGWIQNLGEAYSVLYSLNCEVQEYLACGNGVNIFRSQVLVAVIDPNTCEPWGTPGIDPVTGLAVNQGNTFGQLNANGSCGKSRTELLFYWDQYNGQAGLINFLDNIVPDSAYVLIYSWLISPNNFYGYPVPGAFAPWAPASLTSFHNLGFNSIDTIDLSYPWIFFAKKGDLSSVQTVIGTYPEDILDFQTLICNNPFITPASPALCSGATTTLSGPTGLLGYEWSTGETAQTILISDTGYYSLTVILNDSVHYSQDSIYNCLYTDSIYIGAVSCTGIEELENNFSVSPNPAKDNINIVLKRSFSKAVELNIYTIYGALKKSYLIPANKNSFEISVVDFAYGVYLISIDMDENNSFPRKVVVLN